MSNAALPYAPGDVVDGKYRIDAVIGVGGMGVVARGLHLVLGEPVALKFLRADREADAVVHERFLQEGRIAAKLKGERLVRVLDAARSAEGIVYLVMEYLEGEDLSRRLARAGTFDPFEAAWLGVQMCEALAPAHVCGVVHRDIKPSNLFLLAGEEPDCWLKLLDFGISKVLTEANVDCGLTSSSASLGSPLYMSPEQMQAPGSVDARSDIWSIGAVLHEVLTGASPFQAASLPATVARVLSAKATLVSVPGGDERAWRKVLARCLAKNPERRYRDVRELGRDLALLCGERADAARERVDRLPSESSPSTPRSADEAGYRRRVDARGRTSRTLWMAGLLALGVGGSFAVLLSRREEPQAVQSTTTVEAERAPAKHAALPSTEPRESPDAASQPMNQPSVPIASLEVAPLTAPTSALLSAPKPAAAKSTAPQSTAPQNTAPPGAPPAPSKTLPSAMVAPAAQATAASEPAPKSKGELEQEALSSRF